LKKFASDGGTLDAGGNGGGTAIRGGAITGGTLPMMGGLRNLSFMIGKAAERRRALSV
jgi:hypothetical protein